MQNYNKKFSQFYSSLAWKSLRNYKFSNENGLCEACKHLGMVKEGIDVHHKIAIETDISKALDYDNLELLCKECHNERHSRISQLQKFLEEDKLWEDDCQK